jgi:hypothetical protein
MTASPPGSEFGGDGQPFSIPILPRDADKVRAWCNERCDGDFLIVLGRRVVFERRGEAALAALYWRAEGD